MLKSPSRNSKGARLEFRVSESQKTLLEQAAATQGKKLSEFVIGASTEAAELVLAEQNRFFLPEAQMKKFLATLEEEPGDVTAIRDLFARKSVFK